MSNEWERLASHEGGTVIGLATASADRGGERVLFAATATGLYRSGDGGRAWSPTSDTPLPLLTTVAPSGRFAENHLLFAGTQTGFYRSTDAGRTWQQTLAEGRVFAIAVVPGAGGAERLFIGTQEDGVLTSDDGGRRWTGANPGLLDLTVLALAFSLESTRDLTGFAATASGLYRTRNGGKSWREVALPLDEPAVQCLAISPAFARDRCVLAGTENAGLWRSDDGGITWESVYGLPAGGIDAVAFSPCDAEARLIAAATAEGVALSRDGGAHWSLTGQTLPPALDLAFVPNNDGERLVAGLYRDGIARLDPHAGDDRWVSANTGLTATFLTGIVTSPSFSRDRTLFAVGPEAGIRVSRDGGHTWANAGAGLSDSAVYRVAAAPGDAGDPDFCLFAATGAGIYRSRDSGVRWDMPTPGSAVPTGLIAAGTPTQGGIAPVFAALLDGGLIASDDDGAQWRPLDTPFDGDTVVSLACTSNRTLYVGTIRAASTGTGAVTVWRSTDDGAQWVRWLEERGGGILPLATATGDARDTLFVGLAGRVMQPRRNAWQTRDGVRAPLWLGTALTTKEGTATITALAVSPTGRDDAVFAATSAGVFRSHTHGRDFHQWSEGLTPLPILALATTDDAPALVFALGVDGTIWQRRNDE